MEVTITDPATIARMMSGLKAAPVRKFAEPGGTAVSPARQKMLDELGDLLTPENLGMVSDEALAAFRDELKAASMSGGNANLSEAAKVRLFAERNADMLRLSGKSVSKFCEDFAVAQKKGYKARDYIGAA